VLFYIALRQRTVLDARTESESLIKSECGTKEKDSNTAHLRRVPYTRNIVLMLMSVSPFARVELFGGREPTSPRERNFRLSFVRDDFPNDIESASIIA